MKIMKSSSKRPTLLLLRARFPTLAVEKEFAQVVGREDTTGLTDQQALRSLLSDRANRYLARELCWVFAIEGL